MSYIKAKYNNLVRPYMRVEKQGFGSVYGGNQISDVSNSERLDNIVNSSTGNMFVGNRLFSYTNLNTGQQLVFTNDSVFIVDNSTSDITEIDTQVALQFINESEWVKDVEVVEEENFSFQFVVKTDNAGTSNDDQFSIPLHSSFGVNVRTAIIDWGDGTTDEITSRLAPEWTHTYATAGTYTIKIDNEFRGMQFNNKFDKLKMIEIQNWGVFDLSTGKVFKGCSNLNVTAQDTPIVSTNHLGETFNSCAVLNGNIQSYNLWDMSAVTNISQFARFTEFNSPINNWDVSNVTNMTSAFANNPVFDQDLSSWDVSSVSSASNFLLSSSSFSTENYDKLLIGWEATMQSKFPNGSGYSLSPSWRFQTRYTGGGAAESARTSLINNFNWTIVDSGTV